MKRLIAGAVCALAIGASAPGAEAATITLENFGMVSPLACTIFPDLCPYQFEYGLHVAANETLTTGQTFVIEDFGVAYSVVNWTEFSAPTLTLHNPGFPTNPALVTPTNDFNILDLMLVYNGQTRVAGQHDAFDWRYSFYTPSHTSTASTFIISSGQSGPIAAPQFPLLVPEPATWAMMIFGMGMVGLGLRTRRRRLSAGAMLG